MLPLKYPKWLQNLYEQWRSQEADPACMGVQITPPQGVIHDDAYYNDFSQGRPEWLQKENEGWSPLR